MDHPTEPPAEDLAAEIEVLHGEIAQLLQQLSEAASSATDDREPNRKGDT